MRQRRTGRVHFAPFATSLGSSYRADSRLFIDSPPDEVDRYYREEPDMPRNVFQTIYYVWDEFRQRFEPVTPSESAPATRNRDRRDAPPRRRSGQWHAMGTA
jgi:hypothetical protein